MSEQAQLEALLVERGLLSAVQLAAATAEQAMTGRSLTRVLIELGLVQEADLVATIAALRGMEFVDLAVYPVDPVAVSIIPDSLARRYHALPIAWDDGVLVVAMADPANVLAVDDIRSMSGSERRMDRRAAANVMPAFTFTCTWLTPASRYSTGSSTVMMFLAGSFSWLRVA